MVDIVIPCRSTDLGVLDLLRSLQGMDRTHLLGLFVVFNPEIPDWSRRLFSEFDLPITVLESPFLNVNRARNLGAQVGVADIVYFIDADCVLGDPLTVTRIQSLFDNNQRLCGVGGPYARLESGGGVDLVYNWIQRAWLFDGDREDGTNWNLLGGNLAVSKKKLRLIQFDESIAFGASETEFVERMGLEGWAFELCPQLVLGHIHRLSLRAYFRKAFLQGQHSVNLLAHKTKRVLFIESRHRAQIYGERPRGLEASVLLWAYGFFYRLGASGKSFSFCGVVGAAFLEGLSNLRQKTLSRLAFLRARLGRP